MVVFYSEGAVGEMNAAEQKRKKTKGRAVPLDAHIGQNLRLFREMADLSQEELARQVNITFQQLQKNENGTDRIPASRLYEFAEILGHDVHDFYDGYDGVFKNKDIEFLHSIPPEMKLLVQRLSNIQNTRNRTRIIKAFSTLANSYCEAEEENA